KLHTKKGTAVCQKIDIFKGLLWYAYEGEWMNWHKLTAEQANKIIDANKKREDVGSLEEFEAVLQIEEEKPDFNNVVGQDSLTRFDKPKSQNKRRNKKRKKRKGKPSKNA
ncbi:MAG: hypothetical protein WAM00_11315, partial [Salegentibacter sp.]